MKRIVRVLILITAALCYLLAASLFAGDDRADKIIAKVKKKYDKIKTFSAEFNQTFHWKLADNVQELKGKIWLKGQEKFKIETEDQTIVSNGKTIWTFSRFNKQVIIDNIDKSGDQFRLPKDIFFKYSEQYHTAYVKSEKIQDQDCDVIELQAKTEDVFIKYMKIWISNNMLPLKIEQVDLNQNTNTYSLEHIQLNKPIDDSFFVYQVPESIEVIDMR